MASDCHAEVDIINNHGLIALVIPEKFQLYQALSHIQVKEVKDAVKNDREVRAMAFHIRNGVRFQDWQEIIEENREMIIDDFQH